MRRAWPEEAKERRWRPVRSGARKGAGKGIPDAKCNNCGKPDHYKYECWAPGGGAAAGMMGGVVGYGPGVPEPIGPPGAQVVADVEADAAALGAEALGSRLTELEAALEAGAAQRDGLASRLAELEAGAAAGGAAADAGSAADDAIAQRGAAREDRRGAALAEEVKAVKAG